MIPAGLLVTGTRPPVEGIEEGGTAAPAGLDPHVEVEEEPDAEQALDLLARLRADSFQHCTLRSDDDGLLSGPLHADGREDAGEACEIGK
jgi:hypothetical protein